MATVAYAQLANTNFVERAPAEKVDALQERSEEIAHQLSTTRDNLANIS